MEREELLALGIEESVADRIVEETQSMKEEYEVRMAQLRKESEIEMMLLKSGARNVKAVRALISEADTECVAEEIERLKKSEDTRFLFERKQSHYPARSGERLPDSTRGDFEARLSEARKRGDTIAAIRIKQQAAEEGIMLI